MRALSLNYLDVNQTMVLHAVILNLIDHENGSELWNVDVLKEVLRILGVPLKIFF